MNRRTLISVLIGLGLMVGVVYLPLDTQKVSHHSATRLARDGLKTLAGENPKPEKAVRVVIEAPDYLHPVLLKQVEQPTIDEDGWRPAFKASADPTAPELRLIFETHAESGQATLSGQLGDRTFASNARMADGWSLAPPLLALILAVTLRRVIPALLGAVLLGGAIMHQSVFAALLAEVTGAMGAISGFVGIKSFPTDGYLSKVVADSFNLQILGFTFALIGLVAVVGRMGGTRGLVNILERFARGPRSAQAVTSVMGTALFFDDYANTVVVGTTGRSITDRFRMSREKLAYIVDSTSAPVAGVAIVSTWIGYEVGLFDDLLGVLVGVPDIPGSGYQLFFELLPMRFYCFFALGLVFIGAFMGRDMGPMLHAENRARRGGPLIPPDPGMNPSEAPEKIEALEKPGAPARALNAIIPIGSVLAFMLWSILDAGGGALSGGWFSLEAWKLVFDTASDDIGSILFTSALAGSGVAIALAVGQGILSVREAIESYVGSIWHLAGAAAILILAWSIKSVCDDVGTGTAMVTLVGDSIAPLWLPLSIFFLSGVVAFSTGTSWGTMALVLPIAAPLAVELSGETLVVLACLGSVLDGAIWGDHCSPISDTTVLSSTASGCPHLAHVKTQIPYATLAMSAAGLAGYVGVVAGVPIVLCYLLGFGMLAGGLYLFGKPVELAS